MVLMNKNRILLFGSLVAAAMLFGVLLGATVLAKSSVTPASAAAAAASPAPSFKSNEDPAHEKGETAAQEAAENSGRRPFGGRNGHSNEDPTHEKGETAAQEAAENAAATASPTP
jgi:uncharacterized membrane protein